MLRSGLNSIVRVILKQPVQPLVVSTKYGFFNANKMFNNNLLEGFSHPTSLNYFNFQNFGKITVKVPKAADSVTEGTIFEYKKKIGEYVNRDEVVVELETAKTNLEILASDAGVITAIHAQKGDTVEVGAPVFEIDTDAKPTATADVPKEQQSPPKEQKKEETKQEASKQPSQEASKQPKQVQAQPQQQQQQQQKQTQSQKQTQPPAAKQQQDKKQVEAPPQQQTQQQFSRNERREKMSQMRKTIANRLKEAQNTYALLTTFQETDMSNLMKLRKELAEDFVKKYNVKLGFMSFFIKAATQAIQEQPIINSVFQGNEIIHRDYIDVSVAVATPKGLLVPVIKNCESLNFAQIEKALIDLSEKGKKGKITIEDMEGGTFTISNGGVFGSLMGTPILNPPQSAILGMHAIINRPVVRNDQIVARPMMYLALTYDHRIIDGREAATFLKKIANLIEDPRRLLLSV